jgi:N-carbamoylputrescine amidase
MTTSSLLQIGLIQGKVLPTAKENYAILEHKIHLAVQKGAKLILLSELHNYPYFPQIESPHFFDLAEPLDGPTTQFFKNIAKQLQVVIVTSIFEKRTAGLYHNTAVVIEKSGEIAGFYRKMHIPDDPGFYEKFYFTPSDLGFCPITTSIGKLGVLVCWDQWFPEGARLMTLQGADLLLYPTAIGWQPGDNSDEKQRQLNAWEIIQRSHAIANGLPVVVCNRVGTEDNIEFWGNSFICGPQGEILAKASTNEEVLVKAVDLSATEKIRRIWPFLRDRRIDAYHPLIERFIAVK